jgi:hypothetical protein
MSTAHPSVTTSYSQSHWLESLSRAVLLVYVVIVASPMRYWRIRNSDVDYTWIFVLNYGAAHGLRSGRDLLWTNGPLGFLTFPQNIGHNLVYGLLFQACLSVVMIAIFYDLYFRAGIPLRRLVLFSIAIGFASPLFWFNRNSEGVLLAAVLVLLLLVRFGGSGNIRYVTALVLIGVLPFIKLSSGLLAFLILAGFLLDQWLQNGRQAWRRIVIGLTVPTAVMALLCLTIPGWAALRSFVYGSWNLFSGYYTMSTGGPMAELLAALIIVPAVGALLLLSAKPPIARFYLLLLGPSLLFSLKHGFVRQQDHTASFFCFTVLSLGLIVLEVEFRGWQQYFAALCFAAPVFFILTQPTPLPLFFADAAGVRMFRAMQQAWDSLANGNTSDQEKALMGASAPPPLLSPELRKIIGSSTVAVLSLNYSAAYFDGLNLQFYPVILRYSAYTPYLDGRNAEWIRSTGPRFLIFDGDTVDGRHPWAENPATWLEIFRNYHLRALRDKTLLLERMEQPRFTRLESVRKLEVKMPGTLPLPVSHDNEFWSLQCETPVANTLRKLLFRVPMPTMTVVAADGSSRTFRSITNVISSAVMGNSLPATLPEFAALFDATRVPAVENRALIFGGTGARLIGPQCEAQFFEPVK